MTNHCMIADNHIRAGESSLGEPEEYFTFMTPEAYNAVKEWMNYRASFGEEIIGESWVLRNTW